MFAIMEVNTDLFAVENESNTHKTANHWHKVAIIEKFYH